MIEYCNEHGEIVHLAEEECREVFTLLLSGELDLYGWGATKYEYPLLWKFPYPYKAIFDKAASLKGESWNGFPIKSPDEIMAISPERSLIVILPIGPVSLISDIKKEIMQSGPFKVISSAFFPFWMNVFPKNSNKQQRDFLLQELSTNITEQPRSGFHQFSQIHLNLLKDIGSLALGDLIEKLSFGKVLPASNQLEGKKITLTIGRFETGGAEKQIISLAVSLKRRGFDVSFLTYSNNHEDSGSYFHLIEEYGIKYTCLESEKLLANSNIFKAAVAEAGPFLRLFMWLLPVDVAMNFYLSYRHFQLHKPDIVICYLDMPSISSGFAALLAGVPKIGLSGRSFNPTNSPQFFTGPMLKQFKEIYGLMLQYDQVVFYTNSKAASMSYSSWLGLEEGAIDIVPNCLAAGFSDGMKNANGGKIRKEFHIANDEILILGVFRLSEEKNPLLFLSVVSELRAFLPEMKVAICGVGPLREEILCKAQQQGFTEENFFLLGDCDDVASWMDTADMLLHTANFESMPNVIIEAQAAGLPIVCTKAGGTEDCLSDKLRPYLCNVGDEQALVSACKQLLFATNRDVWMQDVIAEVIIKFSSEKLVSRTLKILG